MRTPQNSRPILSVRTGGNIDLNPTQNLYLSNDSGHFEARTPHKSKASAQIPHTPLCTPKRRVAYAQSILAGVCGIRLSAQVVREGFAPQRIALW